MATDELEAFGAGVRALRERRGWTQEKLAEKSELDQTYISGIERGKRNLGFRNLVTVAKAFGITPSELVAESERLKARSPIATRRAR